MKNWRFVFVAVAGGFIWTAAAQDTNDLRTELGQFENRTGTIIVKGYGQVGSVAAGAVEISVRCKETTDVSLGRKVYGLSIGINSNGSPLERIYVDEDEITGLLGGLDYLVKISYDVTALSGFEASYTTKAGLQVFAHSIRKEGGVQFSLQGNNPPRVPLSSIQLSQLQGLIGQARKNLEAIKSGK